MRQKYLLLLVATTLAVTYADHTDPPTESPTESPTSDKCPKEEHTECEEDSCDIAYKKPDYYSDRFDPVFCKDCRYDYNPTCPDQPLVFKTSSVVSRGAFSLRNAIGLIASKSKSDDVHTELTSRRLIDGDVFTLVGNNRQLGVGVCVETCNLDGRVKQDYKKCVSFFGNETSIKGTNQEGEPFEHVMMRSPSKKQGFTYDAGENCVIHIGDWSHKCYSLPDYFARKKLRAIGFVWYSNVAQIEHECEPSPTPHPTHVKPTPHPIVKPTPHPTKKPTHVKPTPHPTKKPTPPHPTKKPTHVKPTPHPIVKHTVSPTKPKYVPPTK